MRASSSRNGQRSQQPSVTDWRIASESWLRDFPRKRPAGNRSPRISGVSIEEPNTMATTRKAAKKKTAKRSTKKAARKTKRTTKKR